MKILQENSTHKAVVNGNQIDISIKGFEIDDLKFDDELIYSIPLENEDDLMAIFERFDEDNRCNMAEFNAQMIECNNF